MLKEINEQADAVAETVADRLATDVVSLGEIGLSDEELRTLKRITIVRDRQREIAELVAQGKVRYLGVSEAGAARSPSPALVRNRSRCALIRLVQAGHLGQ